MLADVHAALGDSLIYEEHKGNFAAAEAVAHAALEAAQQADAEAARLALGMVTLFQGRTQVAAAHFQAVQAHTPPDHPLHLRSAAYALLALHWHYNRFPDGAGAAALEVDARWQAQEQLQAEGARWQALLARARDPNAAAEAFFVHEVLPQVLMARSIFKALPSSFATPARADETVRQVTQPLLGLLQVAYQQGVAPSTQAALAWLLADLFHRARRPDEAARFLQQAEALYAQVDDRAGLGLVQMTRGDWLAAPWGTPVVWNMRVEESPSEDGNLSWAVESEEFNLRGADLAAAAAAYTAAEEAFRAAAAPRGVAAVALRRSYLAVAADDWRRARQHAQEALTGFERAGDWQAAHLARLQVVLTRIGAGQTSPDLDLEAARAVGTWGANEGSFSFALGLGLFVLRVAHHWLTRCHEYERALEALDVAQALFEALGAESNVAQVVAERGAVFEVLGDTDAALTAFEEALARYPDLLASRSAVADRLRRRALSLAQRTYHLAVAFMVPDVMERAVRRLETLARDLPRLDNVGDAGALLKHVLAGRSLDPADVVLQQVAQDTIAESRVLVPLYRARLAAWQGDEVTARQHLALAEAAAQQLAGGQGDFLRALVYAEQGRTDEAEAAFERYLAAGGADAGFTGHIVRFMQMIGAAQGNREAAVQRQRTWEQAFAFMVRIGAYERARTYLERLEAQAGPEWWRDDEAPWYTLGHIGEMYEGLGEYERALVAYRRAIAEVEARRETLVRDEAKTALAGRRDVAFLYLQAARAAHAAGRDEEAFEFVERGKARALLDLMASGAQRLAGYADEPAAMRAWRETLAFLSAQRRLLALAYRANPPDAERIAALQAEIAEAGARRRALEAELAANAPAWRQMSEAEARVLSVAEVAAALPPDVLLLEYAWQGDEMLAGAITADGLQRLHRATVPRGQLNRTLVAFWQACATRAPVSPHDVALADVLLAPFADLLRRYERLFVVPSGALHRLPFHALPLDGAPLGLTRVASYLPAASALQFRRPWALRAEARLLSIGNPANMHAPPGPGRRAQPLAPLPFAELEARAVAARFPNAVGLFGSAANERAVRTQMPNADLLHIATHGLLDAQAPLHSAVALADGDVLTVYEMMGMRLRAQLAVLSACETALGELTHGDDVLGLTRGMLAAGAARVVVSLWPVNDTATALLMTRFYERLLAGDEPARALQAAQRWLYGLEAEAIGRELTRLQATLAEEGAPAEALEMVARARGLQYEAAPQALPAYAHPFYWAPFVVVG